MTPTEVEVMDLLIDLSLMGCEDVRPTPKPAEEP